MVKALEKKYQIFISSTYNDLIEERKKVRDTILSMLHFPVGMEIFGAADEEQWEIIKDTIDSSDYYVLLVANRYGSIVEDGSDKGISYTEKEYRYAKEKGIPILAFLIDDNVPRRLEDIEKENAEKLNAFKEEVKKGRLVEWWENSDELAQKVSISLHKQMDRKKRPGWIRADSFDIEQSHAELLALNKQIRELENVNKKLKEELEFYQQLKTKRTPKLAVTFNVDTLEDELGEKCHPEYAIQDEDTFLHGIKMYDVQMDNIDERYRKISNDDFPPELYEFASASEIDDYNASLPDTEQLEKYKEALRKYLRLKNGCVHINIGVHNNGTAKADSTSIVIEFPDGVDVYDEEMLEVEEPEAPEVGKNPIELAKKRQQNQNPFGVNINRSSILGFKNPLCNFNPTIKSTYDDDDYKLYGQTLEIDCDTIIHTKSYWRRGIYLVGKYPGKYKIKCTLMCEEYEAPQIGYIEFEVE